MSVSRGLQHRLGNSWYTHIDTQLALGETSIDGGVCPLVARQVTEKVAVTGRICTLRRPVHLRLSLDRRLATTRKCPVIIHRIPAS